MSAPTFEMKNAVVVHINTEEGGRDLVTRFLRFCLNEEIIPFRLGSTGPRGLVKVFMAEDAEVIRAWLIGNGIEEVK